MGARLVVGLRGFLSTELSIVVHVAQGAPHVVWNHTLPTSRREDFTMMVAALTGSLLLGVVAFLGFRKAKQNREIFFFHEE